MAVFMLDTDAVTSGISSLESLYSAIQQIEDSVSSYDTSNEDGFDFDSAKSSIAKNIQTCTEKIKGTGSLIDNVVSSHVSLQSSLKFDGSSGKKKVTKTGASSSSTTTNNSSNNINNSGNTSNRSVGYNNNSSAYSSGSSGTFGGGGYSSGVSSVGAVTGAGVGGATVASSGTNNSTSGKSSGESFSRSTSSAGSGSNEKKSAKSSIAASKNVVNSSETNYDVTSNVEKVKYYEFDKTNFKNYSSTLLRNCKSNSEGFVMIGARNAISCDKSIGEVGDIISIQASDGKLIDCIVVENSSNSNTINFYIDKDNFKNTDFVSTLLGDKAEIINKGQYYSLDFSKIDDVKMNSYNSNSDIEILV